MKAILHYYMDYIPGNGRMDFVDGWLTYVIQVYKHLVDE
jgi:hypothetical protein